MFTWTILFCGKRSHAKKCSLSEWINVFLSVFLKANISWPLSKSWLFMTCTCRPFSDLMHFFWLILVCLLKIQMCLADILSEDSADNSWPPFWSCQKKYHFIQTFVKFKFSLRDFNCDRQQSTQTAGSFCPKWFVHLWSGRIRGLEHHTRHGGR